MPTKPPEPSKEPLIYESRVLAYIDILGWRERIYQSMKDTAVMDRVSNAMKTLAKGEMFQRWMRDEVMVGYGHEALASEVAVFSDTVVLSCGPNAIATRILLVQLQRFCLELMATGLYTRGALVRGPLYHKNNVIFGPALNEAHLLESTVAKYPRILVADAIRPKTPKPSTYQYDDELVPYRLVRDDHDGLAVLHILAEFDSLERAVDPAVQLVLEQVRRDLKQHAADVAIRSKLGWLERFIERMIAEADEP